MKSVCISLICLQTVSKDLFSFSPSYINRGTMLCCCHACLHFAKKTFFFKSVFFSWCNASVISVNSITINLNLRGLSEPHNFVIPRQDIQRTVKDLEGKQHHLNFDLHCVSCTLYSSSWLF